MRLQGEINALTAKEAGLVQQNTAARRDAAEALARDLTQIESGAAKSRADFAVAVDRAALDQRRQLGETTAAAGFEAERALEARSHGALLASLADKRAAIVGSDAEQQRERAALQGETEAAERTHQQRLTAINNAAELDRRRFRIEGLQQARGAMSQMFADLFSGTTKMGDALRGFATRIAQTFEQLAAKKLTESIFDATGLGASLNRMFDAVTGFIGRMVAQWIGGEAATTAATTAGEAAKTGAVAAGAATRTTVEASASATSKSLTMGDAIASIGAKAWQAAANVYAAISAIPVVGPFLAPAAAIAAGATVLGFVGKIASSEGGEYRVDQDRLNFVHKDETILPAGFATGLRGLVGEGGPSPILQALQQVATMAGGQSPGGLNINTNDRAERSDGSMAKLQALQAGQRMASAMGWALPGDPARGIMASAMGPSAKDGTVGRMAQSVAQMATGSAGARSGDNFTLNLSAIDGVNARRFLLDNAPHIATAMKQHVRDGGA